MTKRRNRIPDGVVPIDLDAIQDKTVDPQGDFDAWCHEQDRRFEQHINEWGNVE